MEDVSNVEEITSLSVTELKQILTANFINYKGCVEKKELIDKVTMLFKSVEENKKRQGWYLMLLFELFYFYFIYCWVFILIVIG